MRRWDFLHCAPGTTTCSSEPATAPASSSPSGRARTTPTASRTEPSDGRDDWGAYTVDEAALRHGAGVEEETTDDNAYGRFPEEETTRCRDGWLPDY